VALLALLVVVGLNLTASTPKAGAVTYAPRKTGELDCNGFSPIQQSVKHSMLCTDIRGIANLRNANNWNGRFFDNGVYIGHDEPDMTFNSGTPGSGGNVTWVETIGKDPTAAPTVATPGSDVTHYFELTPAPWQSMAMCDGNSYPELPCTPGSDNNAPACTNAFGCSPNAYPGGGSAFMEFQLYPPGMPPFDDSLSCDNTHWCAALTIDSLECTDLYAQCNSGCEEPVNFAFVQTNGVPAGPPSPQLADYQSYTPNSETLLLNPGDKIKIHMWDAAVPGGGGAKAFEVSVDDLTTNQTGYMQASAANGFANTSIVDCSGTPFNFQPEYNTAAQANIIPWAALQTNISTQFETGHFEACTSLSQPFNIGYGSGTDKTYNKCAGPYENAAPGGDGPGNPETGDALCYPAGDTHNGTSAPDQVTGCEVNYFQNGDLDYDGSPYWPDWPTATHTTAKFPGSFVQSLPTSSGSQYGTFFFQTDAALSESTCGGATLSGCAIPPPGPGGFYPYWSETTSSTGSCTIDFGNVSTGTGVTNFGKDAEYGSNQIALLGYPEFESAPYFNTCPGQNGPKK
jgi:hypothetical protein